MSGRANLYCKFDLSCNSVQVQVEACKYHILLNKILDLQVTIVVIILEDKLGVQGKCLN